MSSWLFSTTKYNSFIGQNELENNFCKLAAILPISLNVLIEPMYRNKPNITYLLNVLSAALPRLMSTLFYLPCRSPMQMGHYSVNWTSTNEWPNQSTVSLNDIIFLTKASYPVEALQGTTLTMYR